MKIKSVKYIKSFPNISQFDLPIYPTIAFAGRSNVGKSTLINSLIERKNLVKTSSTPGKTQLLNFFQVNETFYFVDLPGYGFAKVPVSVKSQWVSMIQQFLKNCPELKGVVQLVDIRHPPTENDLSFRDWLGEISVPSLVIANKVDKLKKSQIQPSLGKIRKEMKLPELPLLHSSLKKIGKKEIWSSIEKNFGLIES